VTRVNSNAAHSGGLKQGVSDESWLQTEINGPATLSFSWKAPHSFTGHVCLPLTLKLDGTNQLYCLNQDWTPAMIAIPSGHHTVRWTYLACATDVEVAWNSAGWTTSKSTRPSHSFLLPLTQNGSEIQLQLQAPPGRVTTIETSTT